MERMTKMERIGEILINIFEIILFVALGVCLIGGMIQLYSYCQPLFWIALSILIPTITLFSIGAYNLENYYSEKWWKEIENQK